MVKSSSAKFVEAVYHDIASHLHDKNIIKILQKHLTDQDLYHIKENIYNLDFWINKKFV